jgi:hypothetical protein
MSCMGIFEELLERFVALRDSPRNMRLAASPRRVTFHVGLGRTIWSKLVHFSLLDYFAKAEIALEAQLRWKLFWHDRIPDDTIIEPTVGLDFGVAFEPSLFGIDPQFSEESDPMYSGPVILDHSTLAKMKVPDFYTSGLMPRVHCMYEEMVRLASPVQVRFPGWARGPWSVACMLRGFNELHIDLADNPQFVEDLLSFIVESRIAWEKQRCAFLGIDPRDPSIEWQYVVYRKVASSDQFNDEVDGNLISLATYADRLFPAEKKLSDFYGGTRYYHSCGNLTPFLPVLRGLNPRIMHISSSTDAGVAHALFERSTSFQCSMHPISEILGADEARMRAALRSRLEAVPGRRMEIWADALYQGSADTLAKANEWLRIARSLCSGQ